MVDDKKLDPFDTAQLFINKHFPHCQGALLAGSVVRGESTETSDLDLVVFEKNLSISYRESFFEYGWRIELFVHNQISYKSYFLSDYERARPSMPQMVVEGVILKDDGMISAIKEEARKLLEKGPKEWSAKTIVEKRYFLTDSLDDFIGCNDRAEGIFIAGILAELVSEFVLRVNKRWIGNSKWIVRSLKAYDVEFAHDFVSAFDEYYKTSEKLKVVQLVDRVLEPYGGRLFEGFSNGKE
ncbi:nucleotidyltransferase domain-containing protein [Planococcus halocryophilus]|uniref:Nucleotidyltransferase n=1 Tax=Planococcus halocryophilus TaxID=1215089 RepID=A0A1C7DQ08_9BACL|nr:nucleotidyltransferase domain-containing protein [Planococcus halocryophilus]ANU13293.1 nucleotidyltransferase [Planococcus halocryophilus]